MLAAERGKFLGIVPRTRQVELNPEPEQQLRARLRAAALGDEPAPDARTVALASLVKACGLVKTVFERGERMDADKRIGELAAPDEIGAAVKAVTDATLAAVAAIIIASSGSGGGS